MTALEGLLLIGLPLYAIGFVVACGVILVTVPGEDSIVAVGALALCWPVIVGLLVVAGSLAAVPWLLGRFIIRRRT